MKPNRQDSEKHLKAIKDEHNKYVQAGMLLSDYINPTRGIFNGDRTKIGKMIDHKKLLDGHATHAQRIFASGMNSGMTNKSNIWFRFGIENDDELIEADGVKENIDARQNKMYQVLNKSNCYEAFYSTYEELGQFGTGCYLILPDFEQVVRFRSFTFGEYYLGTNAKGEPNAFGREFEMTVSQLVQEFGLESCSLQVQQLWQNVNQREVKIKVCHLIDENVGRNPMYEDMRNMAFKSCYWEQGNNGDQYLAVRGFKKFPVIGPRWDTITTDTVFGYGPGWHALGSIRELQATKLDKMYMQAKLHNPPVQQDANVDGHASLVPGGVTKSSSTAPNSGVRPTYEVPDAIQSMLEAINDCKEEINKFFFVDLFLMLASLDDTQRTAEEIATRQQEKIMMMGPALHRLDKEMLTPTLELVYHYIEEAGLFPEAPDALDGVELKIEFTSMLAQAQRAVGIEKINRVIAMAGALAQIGLTEALDNLDSDEIMRETQDMEGAPAKTIKDKDIVENIRKERQKQQNQVMAMQAANSAADTANKLGGAPMGEGNALDNTLAAVGGR